MPSLTFWEVNVAVDSRTGNVTKITELRPFSSASPYSSLSANITGALLYGRAYNGVDFQLDDPDPFVLARQNATQLQLPAAVYQAANISPLGFSDSFDNTTLTAITNEIYVSSISPLVGDLPT